MARQPWSPGDRGAPTSNPQSSWCIWSAIHSSISSIHRQGQTGKDMLGTVRASSSSDADDQSAIKEKLGGTHMAILCLIAGFDCIRLRPALIAMVNSTWLMQPCTSGRGLHRQSISDPFAVHVPKCPGAREPPSRHIAILPCVIVIRPVMLHQGPKDVVGCSLACLP